MAEIKLAFLPEFREAMLSGRKTATTRRGVHGEVGDTFEAWGRTFLITGVRDVRLRTVDEVYYHAEGLMAPDYFRVAWRHCGKRWTPDARVWLHFFRLLPTEA